MYQLPACPGNPSYLEKNGKTIKVCTGLLPFLSQPENYDKVIAVLKHQL